MTTSTPEAEHARSRESFHQHVIKLVDRKFRQGFTSARLYMAGATNEDVSRWNDYFDSCQRLSTGYIEFRKWWWQMSNRQFSMPRFTIILMAIVAIIFAPYHVGIWWIISNPLIFKSDALYGSSFGIWGAGLLALCLGGIVLTIALVSIAIVVISAYKWVLPLRNGKM